MEENRFTWRNSRGSSGRLGSCRAAVVLHLKVQIKLRPFFVPCFLACPTCPHILAMGLTVLLGACWALYSGFGSLKLGTSE